MKRNKVIKNKESMGVHTARKHDYFVDNRLDESIPLNSAEWQKVEQVLMRLSEFAPGAIIADLVSNIASYADEQARCGYKLGQSDLMKVLVDRVA
jgi:hypothetical protein